MYLGFDISTSIVVMSLLNKDGSINRFTSVSFTGKKFEKDLFLKTDYFIKEFNHFLGSDKDKIVDWGVEEALKKFSAGKSSASTIFTCASFNFGVSYNVYNILGKKPTYIPPTTARSILDIKIPRDFPDVKSKSELKIAKKSYIVDWCTEYFNYNFDWPKNNKGKYSPKCFDMADSLVLTEALRKKCQML